MNTAILRRWATLAAALIVCAALDAGVERASAHPGRDDTPAASAAPTAADGGAGAPEAGGDAHRGSDADSRDEDDWNDAGRRNHDRRHRGESNGDVVNIGQDSTLSKDSRADSVVAIFGSSRADGEAEDVVAILGDVGVTGHASDAAVAVMGGVDVDGEVDGDVVAVLGDVNLGPHARVGGNVIAVGGTLHRDPGAAVHGKVQSIFAGSFGHFGGLRAWIRHCVIYGRLLSTSADLGWAWGVALAFLALYVLVAVLFREGLFRCVNTFEAYPGRTILAGLIAALAIPVLMLLLLMTVIGIPAIPFALAGIACIGFFGKAVMLAWIGRRITGRRAESEASGAALAVLIGGLVVLGLYTVPLVGMLTFHLLGFLGAGAVAYTALLAFHNRETPPSPTQPRPARPGAAASADAAPPSSGPASSSAAAGARAPDVPPHVALAFPRASFMRRMSALLIDVVVVGFVLHLLWNVHRTELLVLAAYGAVMWKLRGSTLGGIVLDLRVVRQDARAIDWPTAIVRALGCFLSLAVAGLGFFWIAFDPDSQAWHDKIAGTVVVRVGSPAPLV